MALSALTENVLQGTIPDPTAYREVSGLLNAVSLLSTTEAGFLDEVTAGTVAASKAVVVNAAKQVSEFGITDGGLFNLGIDADWTALNRVATLNANTALTGALVGTPVTPALAANSLIIAGKTADGDILIATQTGGNSQAAMFVDASANTTDLFTAGVRIARVSSAGLTLGLAGTTLGKLVLSGNTSGTVTVNTAAAAGDWTLTLPGDNGDAGEQLQTDGSGVCTWEAAGSMRAVKNVLREVSLKAEESLQRLLGTGVYEFTYKEGARTTTGDHKTVYTGIMADELPEVMHHNGRIFSPVSAFGEAVLAIKALASRIDQLQAAH